MTTYADLLTATTEHLRHGNAQLATDRFWSVGEAYEAIGDFHGMLHAIAAHTRRLLWPAKALRPGMDRGVAELSPTERASADLATAIDAVVGKGTPHPAQIRPLTTPWRHAAMHLRAASDLVATHFQRDGSPRTPDGAVTDRRALDAGLAELGQLTAMTLAAEEPLALRALQAGMSKAVVVRHLPGLGHLADLAGAAATDERHSGPSARVRLEALRPTSAPIRTGDPVIELEDRMQHLRLTTWNLTAAQGDALSTLRDVTTIGIAVHAHAAAFHGAQPTTAADPASSAQGAEALLRRGRAWQALHRELAHFITLAPPHAAVRDDLVALSRLLPTLSPLAARTSSAALANPAMRRVGASLNGAVATMTEVGDHSAAAFADLHRTGALRLHARDLPRDLVSDNPELATGRLRGAIVRAPDVVVEGVDAEYRVVREHPVERFAVTVPRGRSLAPRAHLHEAIGHVTRH